MIAPGHRPLLIEIEDGPAADPASAATPFESAPFESAPTGTAIEGRAMQSAARLTTTRRSALGRLALWVFTALFGLILTVNATRFVTGLLASNPVLGWLAFGLFGLALALALIAGLRELAAYSRMARIDRLRDAAIAARATADLAAARGLVAELASLYVNRPDTAWGRARLAERAPDIFDADALLALAETELMAPLDARALTEIEAAARQVATVTAFVPLALADVATALYANLKMIRRLSEIYAGRAGGFGSLRLLRRVFAALLAAGAMALADDLIGSVAGGGILAKLSRRFGEGVVNGALTARVGLAAMQECRPLPFVALPRPGTTTTASRALAGLFGRAEKPD